MKTESKSIHKQQHNSYSKYIPYERMARRTLERDKEKKQTNITFLHLQPVPLVRSPQTLHGGAGRRDH